MNYFENKQDIDHRQERVYNFNQYTGKIDTQSKKLEQEQEKLKSYRSEEDIKKNLQQGQEMIIRSSLNISIKPQQHFNNNLEFIMQSINKDAKYQYKKKNKQQNFQGCQFSEEQLENIQRSSFIPLKTIARFSQSTNESPIKTSTSISKLISESRSTTNLKSQLSPQLNSQNKKSHQHLDVKHSLFDLGGSQYHPTKEKYSSTFTNIENDQDNTDPMKITYSIFPQTDRSQSLQFNQNKSTSNLQSQRLLKLKLDPILIHQSTQIDGGKRNFDDIDNSIQTLEMRSPTGINQSIEIHSDGQAYKKLNLKLKLPSQKERKSIDSNYQDSTRYKSYFNESNTQLSQPINACDPLKIKSFSQLASVNPNSHHQEQNICQDNQQNLNQSTTRRSHSRKNSLETLEVKGSPTIVNKQKINFNRIHARQDHFNQSNLLDKDGFATQRSNSTKKQFLPLKYRINDIVEQKDLFKTMYRDNLKRAKLQQQIKQQYKVSQNPYLEIQTSYNN